MTIIDRIKINFKNLCDRIRSLLAQKMSSSNDSLLQTDENSKIIRALLVARGRDGATLKLLKGNYMRLISVICDFKLNFQTISSMKQHGALQ